MEKSYRLAIEKAKKNRKENKKLTLRLVKNKSKELDELFLSAHERAFEQVDCLKCANCCKTTSPIFRDVDIKRIAEYLRIAEKEFITRYLHVDSENDYVLNSSPCVFLNDDNTCQIYEHRPKACREYPHTDRKRIAGIMPLTLKNAEICPAVAMIFQSLG